MDVFLNKERWSGHDEGVTGFALLDLFHGGALEWVVIVGEGLAVVQELETVLHGNDVARDLGDIITEVEWSAVDLVLQEVGKGRLGAFDLGREDGLLSDIGVEKWERDGR